jgi:hypothetical protein
LFSFFTPGFAADLWPSFVFAASPGLKIHEQLSVVGYRFLRLVDRFVKLNSLGVSPWSPVYIRQSEQGATPVDFLLASIRAGFPFFSQHEPSARSVSHACAYSSVD